MGVYDVNGMALTHVYDADGSEKDIAYDTAGNIVYRGEPPTSASIKVMEYNVGQWYVGGGSIVPTDKFNEYYALQNGMIQSANADILLLCEYRNGFTSNYSALTMLGQYYPYILEQHGSSGDYYGRAICSKYPLSNYTVHNYSVDPVRYYDSVDVTINGVTITLVVTHLSTNDSRRTQITELISYLQTLDTFICAGDLNTVTFTGGATTEADDYTNIIAPLLNAGFNVANCNGQIYLDTYSTAPDGNWYGCLDNIITSSDIIIESVEVDTTKLTDGIADKVDHMPLIAELEIS